VIGDHGGHAATSMTESYAHLYDEVRERTADALDAIWTGDVPAAPRLRGSSSQTLPPRHF
jgi:hypothetical protein